MTQKTILAEDIDIGVFVFARIFIAKSEAEFRVIKIVFVLTLSLQTGIPIPVIYNQLINYFVYWIDKKEK